MPSTAYLYAFIIFGFISLFVLWGLTHAYG
jgi:hypothetical protein